MPVESPPSLPLLPQIDPDRPALLDDNALDWTSYGELAGLVLDWKARLPGPKALVFIYARNDIATVAAMIAALAADHAVALFDPALGVEARTSLETLYEPEWIIDAGIPRRNVDGAGAMHPELAVLLSTSGSTGSPKLVRLTLPAITANAQGIADVFAISSGDVAAAHLPLHYSYGLSVLTSHLAKGARIRLTELGVMDRNFWTTMRVAGITHFPGVPFHYQVLIKLGLGRIGLPTLRTLTQAGGALNVEARRQAHDYMESVGGRFYVMYGQTEAAPRMTTLQHEDFNAAPGSVGTALPDCRLEIPLPNANGEGEVVFHGPNVMMGYAEKRSDLARGDELGGRLVTGDIGRLDDRGLLTLTGRAKRFGKVYGLRVNLDEIEMEAAFMGEVAVIQVGEAVLIHYATEAAAVNEERETMIAVRLGERFTLPRSAYRFQAVRRIPRTERGKIDYAALDALQ